MKRNTSPLVSNSMGSNHIGRLAQCLVGAPMAAWAWHSGLPLPLCVLYGCGGTVAVRIVRGILHAVGVHFVYLVEGERRSLTQRKLCCARFATVSSPIPIRSVGQRESDRKLVLPSDNWRPCNRHSTEPHCGAVFWMSQKLLKEIASQIIQ